MESKYEKNERIRAPKIRLIDENGVNVGVVDTRDALNQARNLDLDLVLIAKGTDHPVARIIDWSKFKYIRNKKQKGGKSKGEVMKEYWFKTNIEDFHIGIKLEQVRRFLVKGGGRAKLTVRGGHKVGYEQMKEAMNRVIELAKEKFELNSEITKEGKNLVVFVKLKPKNNETKDQNTQGNS